MGSKTHGHFDHLMQHDTLQHDIEQLSQAPFPRLVNCSDDPSGIGKMLYHIPADNAEHSLGSDDSNDIRLPSRAGVLPRVCTLRNDGQHVWVRPAHPGEDREHSEVADVWLDGVQLGPQEAQVRHLNCLHFGSAMAFHLCAEQASTKELFCMWSESPTDSSVEELVSLILGEERAGKRDQIGQAAQKYLRDACKAQEPQNVKSLLSKAEDARSIVSRANSITEEARRGSGLRFELVAHVPVPPPDPGPAVPELGVRLVRVRDEEIGPTTPAFGSAKPPAGAAWGRRGEGYEVLCTWPVEKMAARLELMERPSDHLVGDPWAEYGLGKIPDVRSDCDDRLREAHEVQRLLQHENDQPRLRLPIGRRGASRTWSDCDDRLADKAFPDLERTDGSLPEPEPEGGSLDIAARLLESAERNRSLVRKILSLRKPGSPPEAKTAGLSMQAPAVFKRAAFDDRISGRRGAGPGGRHCDDDEAEEHALSDAEELVNS